MNFDQSVLYFFNQALANPILDVIMLSATTWSLLLMPLLGIAYFVWGSRSVGKTLLWTLVASLALTTIFYYLAFRPRPVDVRLIMPTPPFPSFPSGHTTMAFGLAMAWGLVAFFSAWERHITIGKEENRSQRSHLGMTLTAMMLVYVIASIIAVSRLYLGHHYPTDVIAGAVLGSATGAAIYGLVAVEGTIVERIRWLLWPQIAIAILVTMMAYLDVLPIHLLRFPFSDKVLHFLLFGSITFWLQLWLQKQSLRLGKITLPLSIGLPLTLALIEEGFQALSPLRTASLMDLSADAVGMFFFFVMAQRLISLKPSKSRLNYYTDSNQK